MCSRKNIRLESQDDEAYVLGKKPKEKCIETPGPGREAKPFQAEEVSAKEPTEKPEKLEVLENVSGDGAEPRRKARRNTDAKR